MTSTTRPLEPIKVLDLFAGCGGLTEGFHQFRPDGVEETAPPVFHSVGAVEWDAAAAASYAMNFGPSSRRQLHHEGTAIFCRDITGWTPPWKPGEIDVVVGGPPCQGFSGLNRNKVGAERNQLWQRFIDVVVAVQPKVFVIENVDRFVRSPEFADLKSRVGKDGLKDYVLCEAPGTKPDDSDQVRARKYLLNAANYGALQARRRAIVIGVRTDLGVEAGAFTYPRREYSESALVHRETLEGLDQAGGERAWRTIDPLFEETARLALERTDLPEGGSTTIPEVGRELRGPFRTTELHFTRSPEPVSLARYRAIPRAGNRKSLRGRFWCRFRDGEELIVEKTTAYRGADDKLNLSGGYTEVVDGGRLGTRTLTVTSSALEPHVFKGRSSRNKAEAYEVQVKDGERRRKAEFVYLSTESWDRHDSGSGDVMGRLRLGAPSVTVRTEFFKPEKGRYLHPTEDRPITHYEAALLQGFPKDFWWCGSKTDIARQIGNAVPIPLGRAIAGSIYEFLSTASTGRAVADSPPQ